MQAPRRRPRRAVPSPALRPPAGPSAPPPRSWPWPSSIAASPRSGSARAPRARAATARRAPRRTLPAPAAHCSTHPRRVRRFAPTSDPDRREIPAATDGRAAAGRRRAARLSGAWCRQDSRRCTPASRYPSCSRSKSMKVRAMPAAPHRFLSVCTHAAHCRQTQPRIRPRPAARASGENAAEKWAVNLKARSDGYRKKRMKARSPSVGFVSNLRSRGAWRAGGAISLHYMSR